MILKVRRLSNDAILPCYAHPGDAGLDLFSNEEKTIEPGTHALVRTGVSIELPPQTEAQVRPRSGLALKHGITVLNSPGTIDAGYRGEVGVILMNHGRERMLITKGMKIAQMVVKKVEAAEVVETVDLTDTSRGSGGFGSTGYNNNNRDKEAL